MEKGTNLFFCIIWPFRSSDHGVKLRYHDDTFSQTAKLSSGQFVDEVTEGVIGFLFVFEILGWKLQLALNFPHKQIVYDDVACRII